MAGRALRHGGNPSWNDLVEDRKRRLHAGAAFRHLDRRAAFGVEVVHLAVLRHGAGQLDPGLRDEPERLGGRRLLDLVDDQVAFADSNIKLPSELVDA